MGPTVEGGDEPACGARREEEAEWALGERGEEELGNST